MSRSGATITAGRLLGYSRASGGPVLVPAVRPGRRAVRALRGPAHRRRRWPGLGSDDRGHASSAFVVGYAAIAWLLRYLAKHSMLVFGIYRVVVGVLMLGLVYGGVVAAT